MHGTAVFHVSDEVDVEVFEPALGLLYRVEVEKGLGRVLVGSVSGVDDRNRCYRCCYVGCACDRMSHHDHVDIVGDDLYRVFKGLSLCLACIAVVRKADHPCAKPVDRGLE